MKNKPIFVYGSLQAGAERDIFKDMERTVVPGNIHGALMYDLGFFPGIKLSDTGIVKGELHFYNKKHQYRQVLTLMDQIEGYHGKKSDLYTREKVLITLESGEKIEAYTYTFNGDVSDADIIDSGEWKENKNK